MNAQLSVPFLRRLIGNPRAFAVQNADGSWTPVREMLTNSVLRSHLDGDFTVGTYVLDGNKAKTLIFDIDNGHEASEVDATAIAVALNGLGIPKRGTGIEFSGRKGYHVWVVFAAPVKAADLRKLGRAVLAITGVTCEVFPKQDSTTDLGNLVKLPGGIHRVAGVRSHFITPLPIPLSPQVLPNVLGRLPEEPKVVSNYEAGEVAIPCVDFITTPGNVEEGGRNIALFQVATMARRHSYSEEVVRVIVEETNLGFAVPLRVDEVNSILKSSRGSGFPCDPALPGHCGDKCLKNRRKSVAPREWGD